MTVRLMLIVMLAMLCPVAAMAQDADYVWRNVKVGGGWTAGPTACRRSRA